MVTLGWFASLALASMLAFAAVAKLVALRATSPAIGDLLGLRSPRLASAVTVALSAGELLLCGALLAQLPVAAAIAAVALSAFTAVQAHTLATRGAGVRCGCLGPRSTITRASLARTVAWAALALALAISSPDAVDARLMGWSVAVVALGALAGAVGVALELARRVVMLTEQRGPEGALEIAGEGPPLGAVLTLAGDSTTADLRLAVFVSPACGLCRSLRPAIDAFAAQPGVTVTVFDEERDPGAWRLAGIPGSPYAVARDGDGAVLAKGAFNTMRQLESVCATAQHRVRASLDRERDDAEAA